MLAQLEDYSFRIIGLSGTCYRDKAQSIVGPELLFKSKLCSISTSWLIEQGYLVKPHFGMTQAQKIDFSECKVLSTGNFATKDLERAIHKDERLTGEIMRELQTIKCNGVFIFASTRKHCEECARSLPDGSWAIITGETPHEDRKNYLKRALVGSLRYLISVNCLGVGVDIPNFDACAWLRPTESLILYVQGIGRVLRLSPEKKQAIILDYAGNLKRHGDVDNSIINEALQPREENEKDYCIPCYTCSTLNTTTARRCIGHVNQHRCDHYFEFKDCLSCRTVNDITSRHCRECDAELIDPNAKLSRLKDGLFEFDVEEALYWISITTNQYGKFPIINAQYKTNVRMIFESYTTHSEKAKNITYARFIRPHLQNASYWYMEMHSVERMQNMIKSSGIKTPHTLMCKQNEYGRYEIVKKLFQTIE
jgi:DNA repair protein RadD